MKQLIIIGARGFGREIYNLAIETKEYKNEYEVKGFLDDKQDALAGYKGYPPIISSVEDYVIQEDDVFICALGDVNYKRKYVEIILNKGGDFITLIHPTAHIGMNTKIGKGCIILQNVHISCDIEIGDFVSIQPFSAVGHDVKIKDWCHLNAYSFFGGYVEVEEMATVQTGGIIVPHKKIGRNAVLGAGSVAIKNVKEGSTVFGVPAKNLEF
ncbi:MAG: acetyltransferase [Treponema sp.]|nr:acetyltransferase [Treponema sp.]